MTRTRHSLSTEMTLLVTPELSNFGGNMHGGELLKLLDKVAFTCSVRYSRRHTVTLSVNEVLFKQPIHIGELLYVQASVNYTGRTSMEIGIRVVAEDLKTGKVLHTNTSYFTMVAVDDDGNPTPVPTHTPETEDEKRRWKEAVARRKRSAEDTA